MAKFYITYRNSQAAGANQTLYAKQLDLSDDNAWFLFLGDDDNVRAWMRADDVRIITRIDEPEA